MKDLKKTQSGGKAMSCWTKEELENMLEDVVNELDLSELASETHGQLGTPPAELVKLVLVEKDKRIAVLQAGMNIIEVTVHKQINGGHHDTR